MSDPADPNKPSTPPANPSIEALAKKLQLEQETEINKKFEERKKHLDDIIKTTKDINEINNKTKEFLDLYAKRYTDAQEKINNIKENFDNIVDAEQILKDTEEERLALLQEDYKLNQKNYLLLLEQIKAETNAERKTALEEQRKVLLERIKSQADEIKNDKDIKKGKEEILSIAKQIKEQAIQYTFELEKHIMNISKLNGGYAEYGEKLREANIQIYQATAGSGIMFEEANAAFAEISKNFIGLTTQSQESIKTMTVGAAQLAKVGVDAGAAAKGFDSLVNSMGRTPQQAYKIQESFVQMAAKNRLALGAVSQAFAENSSRFVGYGEQMTKVLDGLAEQSLKTGVAINSLVKIAQQFDTFEGAAKAVGNLNALLGGDYFNSVELLTATDDERIKLLKEGVAASGMQWESMNRFQKMAVANAAGINDLNEASKIFGKTSLENTKQQAEGAAVQKTLAEQAESVSTSMDKMKSVINGVIIALDPLVTVLGYIVSGLTWFARAGGKAGEEVGGWGGKVITVFGSLISLGMILAAKNLLLGKSFGGIGSAIGGAVKKLWEWIAGKKAASQLPVADIQRTTSSQLASGSAPGPSASAGPGRFTSFVNNIKPGNLIAAAAALLIFAAAMFVMAKAFQEFSSVQDPKKAVGLAVAALIMLGAAMFGLNAIKSEIIKGSIIIGIMALVLLGFGIALGKFVNIDWKIIAGIGIILVALSLAILGLGLALSGGPQALVFAAGLAVIAMLALTLGLLGAALISIVKAIESASPALSNLANSFKQLFEIKDLKDNFTSIESFLSQLSTIDYDPINNLANAVGLLAENLQKLASISQNMNIKGNVETTTTQNIQTLANQAGESAVAIGEAASTKQQTLIPAQQTTAFVPLIVQIDGKNIIDILKKDIEIISGQETLRMIESVGIAQSADYVQASPVVIEGP